MLKGGEEDRGPLTPDEIRRLQEQVRVCEGVMCDMNSWCVCSSAHVIDSLRDQAFASRQMPAHCDIALALSHSNYHHGIIAAPTFSRPRSCALPPASPHTSRSRRTVLTLHPRPHSTLVAPCCSSGQRLMCSKRSCAPAGSWGRVVL